MSISYHVPIPAIRGHFGRELLWTFQTQVSPDQLVALLGHDPRHEHWRRLSADLQDLYSKIQRKTNKSRRESIEGYLEERVLAPIIPGAFPAICIGMTKPPVFQEGEGEFVDRGILKMDLSPENTRILLDGLGRVAGALAFLAEHPKEKALFTLPVTIYAPHERHKELTIGELGQLFFDFNFKASPISKSHAMELDQADLYLQLTNRLALTDVIKEHGGMETRRQSLGSKSTAIVVQSVLVRFVRGACEGAKFQKANNATTDNPYLSRETFATIRDKLEAFLATLEHEMGPARFGDDRSSLHLSSVGWQALGLVAHDLYFRLPHLDDADRLRVVKEIAGLNWSRGKENREMFTIGVLTEVEGAVGLSGRGVAAVGALHEYIRDKTSLGTLLSDLQDAAPEIAPALAS